MVLINLAPQNFKHKQIMDGSTGTDRNCHTGGAFNKIRMESPVIMESKHLMGGGAFTQMPGEPADKAGQKPTQQAKEPEFSKISARSQSCEMSTDSTHLERRVLKSSELRRTPLRVQPCQKESPSEGVTSMSRCRRLRSFLSELVPKRIKQSSVFK